MHWLLGFDRRLFAPDEGGGGAASSEPAASAGADAAAGSVTSAPAASVTTTSATPSLRDSELPPTNIFEALGTLDDEGPPEPPPSAEPASAQQPPQEPQAPPQAQPAQPAAPQKTEPTQTPQATDAARAAAAPPRVSEPFSSETIQQLEQPDNRDKLVNAMTEAFVLSPEDLNGLATDAAPVLRRIAARVMYATSLHTLKQLKDFSEKHLPQRFQQWQESTRKAEGHRDTFDRMWPALKDPRYSPAIEAAAMQVKKMPGMTQEGLYRTVGRMVAAQFNLSVNPIDIQVAPSGAAPLAAPMRQAAPFAPAATATSASAQSSQSNGTEHPFSGLGMDFD